MGRFSSRLVTLTLYNNIMDFIIHVILAASLIIGLVNGRCSDLNKIEVCNNAGVCVCRPCRTCPKGYGLNMECWGRLKKGTAMKCTPCIEGKTYSNEHSTSRCQPCAQCDGKKVLQRCNTTTQAKCSPYQCEVGYEYNVVVDSCEPVATPKPTVQLLTTTHQPSTTAKPTQSSTVIQVHKRTYTTTAGTLQINHDNQQTTRDTIQNNIDTDTDHSKTHFVNNLVLAIVAVLSLSALVTILYRTRVKIYNYFKSKCGSVKGSEMEMEEIEPLNDSKTQQDSPPHQQVWPWPADLCLTAIIYDLSCAIQTKICKENPPEVHGWRSIGNKLKIPNITLEAIGNYKEEERGKQLFEALKTNQPKLTLKSFVENLKSLGREDIVEFISDYYYKNNTAVRQSQEM